jgi:hypothetical protein
MPQRQFDQALRQGEYLGLPIEAELDPDHTRSELDTRFLAVCRRHRLPKPEVNVRIGRGAPGRVRPLNSGAGLALRGCCFRVGLEIVRGFI